MNLRKIYLFSLIVFLGAANAESKGVFEFVKETRYNVEQFKTQYTKLIALSQMQSDYHLKGSELGYLKQKSFELDFEAIHNQTVEVADHFLDLRAQFESGISKYDGLAQQQSIAQGLASVASMVAQATLGGGGVFVAYQTLFATSATLSRISAFNSAVNQVRNPIKIGLGAIVVYLGASGYEAYYLQPRKAALAHELNKNLKQSYILYSKFCQYIEVSKAYHRSEDKRSVFEVRDEQGDIDPLADYAEIEEFCSSLAVSNDLQAAFSFADQDFE